MAAAVQYVQRQQHDEKEEKAMREKLLLPMGSRKRPREPRDPCSREDGICRCNDCPFLQRNGHLNYATDTDEVYKALQGPTRLFGWNRPA